MIQGGSILKVIDNSGGKSVMCIKVNKGFKKRYAYFGDIIRVSIKTLRLKRRSSAKVKKGEICDALIIRTKVGVCNFNGESLKFLENSVILLNRKKKFFFTRIFGSVPISIRYTKYMRILSVSSGIIK